MHARSIKSAETLGWALLFVVECACVYLAFHTWSGGASLLYALAVFLNAAVIMVALVSPMWGRVTALALALAIVPFQLFLGARYWRVDSEAKRIIAYAYEQRALTGQFPSALGGYDYRDVATRKYISGYAVEKKAGHFHLRYHVGTKTTAHEYTSYAGWSYTAD